MEMLFSYSDLARYLETGTDCSLFKINIDREERVQRRKTKIFIFAGKEEAVPRSLSLTEIVVQQKGES